MLGKLRDVLFILGKEKWACILSVKVCLCNFFFEKKKEKKIKGQGRAGGSCYYLGNSCFHMYVPP